MTGSFQVLAINHTPVIEPGDLIRYDIFITGNGNVSKNKFYILNSHPYLFPEGEVGSVTLGLQTGTTKVNKTGEEIEYLFGGRFEDEVVKQEEKLMNGGITFHLRNFFMDFDEIEERVNKINTMTPVEIDISSISNRDPPAGKLPGLMTESTWGELPPIGIRMETLESYRFRDYLRSIFCKSKEKRCRPGTYTIPLVLSYETNGEIKQTREDVTIKVQSWGERNRELLTLIGLLLTFLSLGFIGEIIATSEYVVRVLTGFVSVL